MSPSVRGLPSVTEVLAACGLTHAYPDTEAMADARRRGHARHLAIKLHAEGRLDEATVHPAIRPEFDAYLRFVVDHGHIPEASELELIHEPYGVCGHLDRVGTVDEWKTCLIEFKPEAMEARDTRLQLAGYRVLWDHHHPERPIERCFGLALGKDGTPRLHDLTDDYARTIFLSAVVVFKERQGR